MTDGRLQRTEDGTSEPQNLRAMERRSLRGQNHKRPDDGRRTTEKDLMMKKNHYLEKLRQKEEGLVIMVARKRPIS
jgi:hypothetical protein